MRRIPKAQLEDTSIEQAYRDEVAAAATVKGDYLFIADKILATIKAKYGRPVAAPPIAQTLSNAAAAAARVIAATLTGQQVAAADDVIAARRAACGACPDLQNGRCLRCGCYYSAKIRLATEKCPVGKW